MTSKPDISEYAGPVVTTDAVVVRTHAGSLELLVHTRENEPYSGKLALPGVYVARGETIRAATDRCLAAKAGVTLGPAAYRRTLDVYDNIDRDPRGHALSVVTLNITHTSSEGDWVPLAAPGHLAFDHNDIATAALAHIREHVWADRGILRALVGDRPTATNTFVDIARATFGIEPHISNLRRTIQTAGHLRPTTATISTGRGRPSVLWEWTQPERT